MSVNTTNSVPTTTVSVAPTETTLLTIDCRSTDTVAIQLVNTDGAQTFNGTVYRRTATEATYAPSTLPDFQGLAPGASVMADIDVRSSAYLQLRGTMSGIGGNVRASYTRRASTP